MVVDWLKIMGWKKENSSERKLPRLSAIEGLVLELLLSVSGEMFGLEMVEKSNGKLKKGTIYVALQRMEKKGLIESKPQERLKPEIGKARRMELVSTRHLRYW